MTTGFMQLFISLRKSPKPQGDELVHVNQNLTTSRSFRFTFAFCRFSRFSFLLYNIFNYPLQSKFTVNLHLEIGFRSTTMY